MKSNTQSLLTAPQVARHCSADLKTIHNWVNAGQIRSFRTPGRHLRFRPEDVVEFLERYGYPIPTELQKYSKHLVMVIDPDAETVDVLRASLGDQHEIKAYDCPVKALLAMGREQPDLIVAELNLPGVDGYHMVERLVDNSETNGAPVIVYSNDGDEEVCAKAGAAVLVRKPDIRRLRRQVGQLLQGNDEDDVQA